MFGPKVRLTYAECTTLIDLLMADEKVLQSEFNNSTGAKAMMAFKQKEIVHGLYVRLMDYRLRIRR